MPRQAGHILDKNSIISIDIKKKAGKYVAAYKQKIAQIIFPHYSLTQKILRVIEFSFLR